MIQLVNWSMNVRCFSFVQEFLSYLSLIQTPSYFSTFRFTLLIIILALFMSAEVMTLGTSCELQYI